MNPPSVKVPAAVYRMEMVFPPLVGTHDILLVPSCFHHATWNDHWLLPLLCRASGVTVKLCGGPVGAEEKRMLYIIAGWPANM